MNTDEKQVDPSANGGTTSVSSDSSVGGADSFPSNNNRDANSVPYSLPNSKKIYIAGKPHPNIRVPFREISLAATKTMSGEIELNEPVRVYDTSGPWGDQDVDVDVTRGVPALRAKWIRDRGDVKEIEGRKVQPIDDGYLSDVHAKSVSRNGSSKFEGESSKLTRKPLRASAGHPVTQLWYARQGIITPEMEFIAIRENGKVAQVSNLRSEAGGTLKTRPTNSLTHQHSGNSFGASLPYQITPEFVRQEVARGRA